MEQLLTHADVVIIKIFSRDPPRGMKFCFDEKIYPEARVRPALVHSRRCYSSLGAETDVYVDIR